MGLIWTHASICGGSGCKCCFGCQDLQMAALAGDTAPSFQFEYDCWECRTKSYCIMSKITRSTGDSAAIGSLVRMQKKLLHCYVSLLRRVIRMESSQCDRTPGPLVPAGVWICPVCSRRFPHRDSLKGHARCNVDTSLNMAPLFAHFYTDNCRRLSLCLLIRPASVVCRPRMMDMFY